MLSWSKRTWCCTLSHGAFWKKIPPEKTTTAWIWPLPCTLKIQWTFVFIETATLLSVKMRWNSAFVFFLRENVCRGLVQRENAFVKKKIRENICTCIIVELSLHLVFAAGESVIWRYLTRGLIWHLYQSSTRPSIYFSDNVSLLSTGVCLQRHPFKVLLKRQITFFKTVMIYRVFRRFSPLVCCSCA